ncbi:Anaphase-promoting complex (APC), Cdc16 subunit, partial [Trachipleistophora hominis]
VYYNSKLYLSALTMSDFIIHTHKDGDIDLCSYKLISCLSLFELNYHHRTLKFIENNEEILNYHTIRTIYLKLGNILEPKKINLALLQDKRNEDFTLADCRLDKKSIEYYLEAMVKKYVDRKNLLINAVESDNRNLEALMALKREDLVSTEEFSELISAGPEWLTKLYTYIMNYNEEIIVSPFFMEAYAYENYKREVTAQLFDLGVEMIEDFPKCSVSYLVLGYYYLSKKKHGEAKKCFYEAIKYDKQIGNLWLFLGLAYSGLKECENAISCYKQAKQLMIGSYKPDFYLAYEYHKMYNIEQASFFYLRAFKIKPEPVVIVRYATLLIYYEYYVDALKILAKVGSVNEFQNVYNLLVAYAFLFTGDLDRSEMFLDKCKRDWRYLATKGFIKHLRSEIETAADIYMDALVQHGRSWVIEDLLRLTVEIKDVKKDNLAYEYANDLFDSMDLKSLDFKPV